MAISGITDEWTREEIVKALEHVAAKRLKYSLQRFVQAVKNNELDYCDYSEMIALLKLLPPNDPIFRTNEQRAAC